MRGWMNEGKSYIPPVAIGEVMRAGGVGIVVASKNSAFAVGDYVNAGLGVQEYCLIPEDQIKRSGIFKIDLRAGSVTQWLNVLGMPGMTGYFGLMDVGQPKAGETVVVSGAAGAVGQTVGQIAKLKGCRVVGIAGGAAKCDWVVRELGFDACIDYKSGDLSASLAIACPKGIDVYFDNVGGPTLDAVLNHMNAFSRIALCGQISGYNNPDVLAIRNVRSFLVNRIALRGFICSDHMDLWRPALKELGELVHDGKLRYRESIAIGLENAPGAFIGLLNGKNFGKQLVKLI